MFFTTQEKSTLIAALNFLQANMDEELRLSLLNHESTKEIFTDEYSLATLEAKLDRNDHLAFILKDEDSFFQDDLCGRVTDIESHGIGISIIGYSDFTSEDSQGMPIYLSK